MGGRRKRVAVLSLGTETDVWNAARITAAWSGRRDVERVEVIGWDLTREVCALLPGAHAVHELPLAGLRVRAAQHPLASAIALRGALDGILSQGAFDAVLNLTYGGFAGHLAPMLALDPHAVIGPFVDETGQWRASHPAFEYLATWGLDPSLNVFAHQDVWSAGAHVRTDEGGLLCDDPVADTLVEHGCGDGPIPVVVAPTEAADGLGFTWDALIPALAHAVGRPVMLVAPPGQSSFVEALSARTGAEVARWPMRHLAALLRRCGALLTSDFATAVLASRVGVRQLWLRGQGPLPLASLPGPHMVSIAAGSSSVSLRSALSFATWFLLQRDTPDPVLRAAADGLSVHEIEHDRGGCLSAASLGPQTPSGHETTLRSWRQIWRAAWINLPPPAADVRHVLAHADGTRLARARLDRGPVGRAIRDGARLRGVAA